MTSLSRCLVLLIATLLCSTAMADVTLRPNESSKESNKAFAKDQKKHGFVSPEPTDGTAKFVVGQSVQVELKVSTPYLGFVKFVIRDQPQHGRLSEIRPDPSGDSNRVLVTYTHNGDSQELFDRFTFAARVGEGSTSAQGVITLIGQKAVAHIVVVETPHFQRVQPGQQDSSTFVLVNSGNAPFSGDLEFPAPFTGPRHIDLAVNEKLSIMVAAKPDSPGAYHIDQELQPGVPSSRMQAVVECAQAFVVTPGSLSLVYDPVSDQRKGVIKIANNSDSPLTLNVECGTRLQMEKSITLGANSSAELPVALAKNDVMLYRGEVWIMQEPSRQKVMVAAEPKPARLRLVSPKDGKIDFGTVIKGKVAEAKITVINEGGAPAVLKSSQTPPFIITTDLSKLKADPGKTEEITVAFQPELPGNYNQSLYIAGNAGRLDLTVTGTLVDPLRAAGPPAAGAATVPPSRPHEAAAPVVPPRASGSRPAAAAAPAPVMVSRPPPTAPASAPAPVASEASAPAPSPVSDSKDKSKAEADSDKPLSKMSPADLKTFGFLMNQGLSVASMPSFRSQSIDPIPNIGVAERGKDNLVLLWQPPKVEPSKYLIERSFLVRNAGTGLWLKSWEPFTQWQPVKSPQDGLTAAKLTGLTPETQYELRVLGIDKDGKFSAPSDIVQVITSSPFRMPSWVWQLLVAVIFLAVAYTGYQFKQGDWQV